MKTIKGVKISSGVVSGPIFHFDRGKLPVPKHFIRKEDFDSEFERFNTAIRKSKDELTQVRDLVHNHLDEDHARIIDAQLLAVQDEEMINAVRELMVREKKNVTWAYFEVMDDYEKLLLKTFSQFFKERTVDLKDIKKRVIYHLSHEKDVIQPEILKPSIIVAEKMSPVDLMHIDHKLTLGIITRYGGVDSHAGILARAFRVPYISNINRIQEIVSYSEIILDADNETILLDITDDIKASYESRIQDFRRHRDNIISDKVANSTKDGVPYHIYLNAGFVDEVKAMDPALIQGIGLFRTEFLCIERNSIPDEDEQFQAYKAVLEKMNDLPVVFRVYDFGRDKLLAMLDLEILQEDHVFDEWGGIGFLLDNPEILKVQLRAILRASIYGNTQIMLPLVMFVEEVTRTKEILETIKSELKREGLAFSKNIELGAMIETSSVLEELDELAKHVDFFSIGTNDLALYLLGSGRMIDLTKNYYHPKIFRAIDKVIKAGNKAGIPVDVCGEMASDPYALIGLTAIGIRSISVSSSALAAVSDEVSKIDIQQCSELVDSILSTDSAFTIYSQLKKFYHEQLE
ncbi:MAG: phosphoenolpyruvate--protein phosphotransferase [Candidatus Marinimicrobia bacterium]|nr:phosphoenolpyruvate--protein phosphotransferase [Candidatus Neomarinimicrobiota bacterium]